MICFLFFRFQQRNIERAMDLTDSFTWEDLPTREAYSGQLTAAGWIPLLMKYSRNAAIVILCFHTVQSTLRMVKNHETMIAAWYPFDWTVSPYYELVIISQVTIFKTEFSSICYCNIMKYSRNAAIAILCFHYVQSTIRIVTNHETMVGTWYSFDWTVSPFYELVNISQVTISKSEFSYIGSHSILHLTQCAN
jgi:hypothetical protein